MSACSAPNLKYFGKSIEVSPFIARNPDRGDGARGARLGSGSNAPAVAICGGKLAADLCRPQLREPFALNRPGWPRFWRPRNMFQYPPRHAWQLGNVYRDKDHRAVGFALERRPARLSIDQEITLGRRINAARARLNGRTNFGV